MEKKAIIFDFDNTIVNSLDYWYKLMFEETFKHYNVPYDPKLREMKKGETNEELAELFIKLTNLKVSPQDVLNFWNINMEYYYTQKIKAIKGVQKFLYGLNKKGYTLVLASATQEKLLKKALKHFDIDIFNYIFTEPATNLGKDEPEFFENILKTLKLKSKDVLLFEDSVHSIKSAISLGIDSCFLLHKYNKEHKSDLEPITKLIITDYKSKSLKSLGL